MSLGNTLRAAREARGMTTSELAARTHMLVQIVEGLENEDFRRIPAPIYGRGFVKLYCEAVDLDPKPLQAEFMELFNRSKDAPPKVTPASARPPDPPPAPPAPVRTESRPEPESGTAPDVPDAASVETVGNPPAAEENVLPEAAPPPPMSDFGELFAQPARQEPQPVPEHRPVQTPAKRSYGDLFGDSYTADEPAPKTSAAEKFRNTMSNVSSGVFANVKKLPPNTTRIATVSALAVVILVLMGWGISVLYKATTPSASADTDSVVTVPADTAEKNEPAKDVAAAEKPEKSRKGGKARPAAAPAAEIPDAPGKLKSTGPDIPALYID